MKSDWTLNHSCRGSKEEPGPGWLAAGLLGSVKIAHGQGRIPVLERSMLIVFSRSPLGSRGFLVARLPSLTGLRTRDGH